jgi:hypothetical protein
MRSFKNWKRISENPCGGYYHVWCREFHADEPYDGGIEIFEHLNSDRLRYQVSAHCAVMFDLVREKDNFFDTLEDAVAYSENCVKEYNRRISEKTVNDLLSDLGQPFLNRIGWTEKETEELTELVETL